MKEVKFRGKRVDNQEWVYGFLVYFPDSQGICCNIIPSLDDYHKVKDVPVNIETVDQYTGLKDKNGKEIYGGDIVKFQDSNVESTYEIVFHEFAWKRKRLFPERKDKTSYFVSLENGRIGIEVISNIYENE